MRLRAKMLIAFLVIAAIIVLAGGLGIWQILKLNGAAGRISENATPHLYALMETRLAVFESDVVIEQILSNTRSINDQEQLVRSLQRAKDHVRVLLDGGEIDGIPVPPVAEGPIRENILRMQRELDPYADLGMERISVFLRTERGDIRVDGAYRNSFTVLTDLSVTASETILDELTVLSREMEITARRGILILGIATVISLVAAIVFALAFSGDVVSRVRRVMDASERLADGDLTVEVAARSRDEVGDMARNIREAVESLRGIISTVADRVDVLQETGDRLQQSTQTTGATVLQIAGLMDASRDQNESLAANVSQTTTIIEEMARSIEALNNSVQQQASAIEESSASIEEMISSIENIASVSNTAREQIERLDTASEEGRHALDEQEDLITQMSSASDRLLEANELIAGVTEQTDLLAMNAAIEAAHAGEAGRGFAVVADEIRKLAEMTGEQSRQVNSDIESIRSLIGRLVAGSRTTTDGFGAIQSSLSEVRNVFHEIHGAMQEQRTGGREILDALRQMRDLTTMVNDGSGEMRAGNEQMLTAIRNVNEITQSSRDSINEVNDGIRRISDAIGDISTASDRNKRQIDQIIDATSRLTLGRGESDDIEVTPMAPTASEVVTDTFYHSPHGEDPALVRGLMPSDGEIVPSYEEI